MLFIRVKRKKISHQYKRDMKAKDDWYINDAHSCLDSFELFDYEALIFSAKCQTVSNIPGGKYLNTIAPGPFLLKCFVDQRQYYPRIHSICNTSTLGGDIIGNNAITNKDSDRWLLHDDQKLRPNPPGEITRIPWSAGCILLTQDSLISFNTILDSYLMKLGDSIDSELVEEM